MTDLRRLLASDATEFERLLLGAAGHEQPSPYQRKRMRRALVLAEFGILTASAKAIAGLASHVVVVAVVASTLAGGTSSTQVAAANDARTSVVARIAGTAGPAQGESLPVAPSAILPYDATAEHLPLVDDSPSDVKASGRTRHLPALHEEIALMDHARRALRSGAPTKALAVLARYRTQFPRGSFGQEVAVLRIEALAASGSRASAVSEAKNFLARQPNSPHAERIRLVMGGGSPR